MLEDELRDNPLCTDERPRLPTNEKSHRGRETRPTYREVIVQLVGDRGGDGPQKQPRHPYPWTNSGALSAILEVAEQYRRSVRHTIVPSRDLDLREHSGDAYRAGNMRESLDEHRQALKGKLNAWNND